MYQVFPTLNNKFPCEGPRVVPTTLDFSTASIFTIDLKTLVQQAKISEVQSLFIDNSDNDRPVSITVAIQNQKIIIPAYCQGYIAILASVALLTVESAGSVSIVNLFAQNFPVSNCIWNANPNNSGQTVSVTNFPAIQQVQVNTGSSFAFSPFTTGANLAVTTTSASVTIAPSAGQNLRLTNTGSETVFIRITSGASTATINDLAIPSNQSIILSAQNTTTLSAICATTSSTLNYVIGNGGI